MVANETGRHFLTFLDGGRVAGFLGAKRLSALQNDGAREVSWAQTRCSGVTPVNKRPGSEASGNTSTLAR